MKSHITHKDSVRQEDLKNFFEEMIEYFDKKIPFLFKKKRDIDIAYCLLHILQERQNIEEFNKKALYILIREMANVDTSDITKIVNVFKRQYYKLLKIYYNEGSLITKKNNNFF